MPAHCLLQVRMYCYGLNVPLRRQAGYMTLILLILFTHSQPLESMTDIQSEGLEAQMTTAWL